MTIAPADNAILNEGMINFNWDALVDATSYQLQIAYPNFDAPIQIVRDTTVTTLAYTTMLEDNDYQWRIKAINDTSETPYTIQSFSVVEDVIDISDQTVVIIAPVDGADIITGTINFNWQSVTGATMYQLQIAYPNFETPIQIIRDEMLTMLSYTTELESNDYEWRIKAINDTSETPYTTQSLFVVEEIIDLSDQTVVIIAPEDNFETSETMVNLSWEAIEEANLYRIIVTNTTDGSIFLEQTTTDAEITVDFISGTYTWEVRGENESQNTPYTQQTITIL